MRKTQHLRIHFSKLFSQSKKKERQLLRRPGIEPGSTGLEGSDHNAHHYTTDALMRE